MNIAIIHYHLNRGGVAHVIANQLRALDTAGNGHINVAIFFGGEHIGWPDNLNNQLSDVSITLCPLNDLAYDTSSTDKSAQLFEGISERLRQLKFEPAETVVHCHNHSLGKNLSLPHCIYQLATNGYALLLQIHDFAEDYRPELYEQFHEFEPASGNGDGTRFLYPQSEHIHYAVLNRRDYQILQAARVNESSLHFLPNSVPDPGPKKDGASARQKLCEQLGIDASLPYILYPVRGIRRKNLGEALLWSAVLHREANFATTLPPFNPMEQPSYESWKSLAADLDLPLLFEVGARADIEFRENMAAATLMLTTSVAEGFGLVFLESWLSGKSLVGRNLPEITADFVDAGLQLDTLTNQIAIPIEWIGKDALVNESFRIYQRVQSSFRFDAWDSSHFQAAFEQTLSGDVIDFARLPAAMQRQVIKRAKKDANDRRQIVELNPSFSAALPENRETGPMIEHNSAVVRSEFSLAAGGQRLSEIYRQLLATVRTDKVGLRIETRRLIEQFLQLSRFFPIRVEQ